MAVKSFTTTLCEIRDGESVIELGEHLQDLVAAVRDSGRSGKLTYTLIVRPASKGSVTTLLIEDSIKVTKPSLERGSTIFFAADNNQLQRNDPRQPELAGLRDVTRHPRATGKDAAANG